MTMFPSIRAALLWILLSGKVSSVRLLNPHTNYIHNRLNFSRTIEIKLSNQLSKVVDPPESPNL
jgi:hypothetical protein